MRYARANQLYSLAACKSVRTVKYCSIAMIVFVVVGEAVFLLPYADELPPPIFGGLVVSSFSAIVATAMSVLEKTLQPHVHISAEKY